MADDRPSVKDEEQYEALREQGAGKEKAARIANTDRSEAGAKGGSSPPYEEWSVEDLRDRAAELGIEGRADMTKGQLIGVLRSR